MNDHDSQNEPSQTTGIIGDDLYLINGRVITNHDDAYAEFMPNGLIGTSEPSMPEHQSMAFPLYYKRVL